MFTWESSAVPFGQSDDHEAGWGAAEAPVFRDVDQEQLLWGDAVWEEAGAVLAAALAEGVRHEVLSASEERELARQLHDAFAALQAFVLQSPRLLGRLVRHVAEERWGGVGAVSDEEAVLDDANVVCGELLSALTQLPLTREMLLSLAEMVGREAPEPGLAVRLQRVYQLRNVFITRNVRLVHFIARQHRERGVDLDDLVQEGVLGLVRAILRYDGEAGTRFSTYAYWWIMQAIRNAIARQRSLIRFPNNVNLQVNRLHGCRLGFWRRFGRWPTREELLRETGLCATALEDLLQLSNYCVSANMPLHEDGDHCLQDDLSELDALPPPEVAYERSEHAVLVERYLGYLTEREATVLKMKYGLGDGVTYTLHEIAPVIGVSAERVRQLEKLALEKIRKCLRREALQ